MTTYRIFKVLTFLVIATFLSIRGAIATELNLDDKGVAIKGFDPVAYFTDGRPVAGSNLHFTEYKGAVYRFANASNLRTFNDNPDKFRPAFGGYCSYGVRVGRKFNIDPNAWEIVDGQLYLLLNAGTLSIWQKKKAENITIAGQIWPKIKSITDEELEKKTE